MTYRGVKKIISGGQTGGDQGGIAAGVTLRLPTGGWVPKGWRTQDGPAPWLAQLGLKEHSSRSYPPRTKLNVRDSDGTLIFGNPGSRGCVLTAKNTQELRRPLYTLVWTRPGSDWSRHVAPFREWLLDNEIEVLNVAGNREAGNPGITQAVHDFLVEALT